MVLGECKFFFPSVDFSKYDKEVLLVLVSFCKTRSVLHDAVFGGIIVAFLCVMTITDVLYRYTYKNSICS